MYSPKANMNIHFYYQPHSHIYVQGLKSVGLSTLYLIAHLYKYESQHMVLKYGTQHFEVLNLRSSQE